MSSTDAVGVETPARYTADDQVLINQNTPAKSTTYLLNSHHHAYKTPTGRPPALQVGGLSSPRTFTPGTIRSSSSSSNTSRSLSSQGSTPGNRHYTPNGLRTPRTLGSKRYVPSPMARDIGLQMTPKFMTPKGKIIYNPFETAILDTLGGSLLSPNVFATTSTPNHEEGSSKPFRWSIEHLAELQPVDIEEIPLSQHVLPPELDSETEQKVQQTIELFFAKNNVVPSPWSDTSQRKIGNHLPQTPSTPDLYSPAALMMAREAKAQVEAAVAALDDAEMKQDSESVACQTMLSLPTNFDLEKVLGEYYTQNQEEQAEDDKDISSSSLRRKLFFHGDTGTPLSPVRGRQFRRSTPMEYSNISPNISPVACRTPNHVIRFGPTTPGSADQFSSSPITSKERFSSPCLRRCSTAPDLMMSPEMSPIGSSTGTKAHTRGSSNLTSPLCLPLQGTPSSGLPSSKPSSHPFNSPGISPIRRIDHNGSYTELSLCRSRTSGEKRKSPDTVRALSGLFCDGDSDTENEDEHHPSKSSPVFHSDACHHLDGPDFIHHCDDIIDEFGMDYEPSPVQQETKEFTFGVDVGDFAGSRRIERFASSTRTEFTDIDPGPDPTDKSADQATTTIQDADTGYNTNSLQLSNPDVHFSGILSNLTQQPSNLMGFSGTCGSSCSLISQQAQNISTNSSVIAHTDLTAQFGKMPISGFGMDVSEGYDSGDGDDLVTSSGLNNNYSFPSKTSSGNSSLILKEKFPPDPLDLNEQKNTIKSNEQEPVSGIVAWDEDRILQRARHLLSKLDGNQGKPETKESTKRIIRKTARRRDLSANGDANDTPRNPIAIPTPHRQEFQKLGIVPDDPSSKNILASEVALTVLQRAGADVARFCQEPLDGTGTSSHLVRSASVPESFNL